jgi:hypothetical protein
MHVRGKSESKSPYSVTLLSIFFERRRLKTFLTQFGLALPLMPLRDDKKVERPYKSYFRGVSAKNDLFFSSTLHLHTLHTHLGPTSKHLHLAPVSIYLPRLCDGLFSKKKPPLEQSDGGSVLAGRRGRPVVLGRVDGHPPVVWRRRPQATCSSPCARQLSRARPCMGRARAPTGASELGRGRTGMQEGQCD